jgi:MATE family multidrug resistance protein
MLTKYKPHYRSNLLLAIPVVISQLGHVLVQFADSVIVGHFAGTVSLAAVSLVNSIFSVMMVIGIGISYGLTPLIAQANGKKDYNACGRLLSNSLLINIFTGVILFVVIYFGLLLSIDKLHQIPAVVAEAKPYLGLLGFSIIPLMIFLAFKQFAEGLGFTRQAMVISIIGNILNVVLGVIFVKGMFGIKPMGVAGVGLSTLIDRILMSVAIAVYILKSSHFKLYLKNFTLKHLDKLQVLKILKITKVIPAPSSPARPIPAINLIAAYESTLVTNPFAMFAKEYSKIEPNKTLILPNLSPRIPHKMPPNNKPAICIFKIY